MALSKENSSGSSQLQGLLDLLVDLEIVNQTKKSSEESPPSNEEAKHQGEGLRVSVGGEVPRFIYKCYAYT
jgi:hypothetical protein